MQKKQQQQQQQQGLMVEDEGVGLGMMGLFSTNPNSNSLASFLPHVHFDSDEALLFNYSCSNNNPKPNRHHEELLSLHQTSNFSNPWETMGMMDGDNESVEEDYDDIQEEKKKKSGMMVLGISGVEMKKKKKKMRKKQVREPRFSFKTLSDVDVLDDGYKWRKYGQKVVKNTHHPRSYYRCTQEKCRVKKKVERLAEDPRMVITTYEGRHAHSPAPDLHLEDRPSNITNFFFF